MSRACRWRAVSSALSKCRQRLWSAHMQSLFRRAAPGSVMQRFVATSVSDVRWFSWSPAHPRAQVVDCHSMLSKDLPALTSQSPQAGVPFPLRWMLEYDSAVMQLHKAMIEPAQDQSNPSKQLPSAGQCTIAMVTLTLITQSVQLAVWPYPAAIAHEYPPSRGNRTCLEPQARFSSRARGRSG